MKMQRNKNMTGLRCTRRILVTAIIMTLMLAMAGISYAATDGAVLDSIMVWINGQPAGEGKVTVDENGAATASIVWSSSNYDYMKVDGVRYDCVNTEGNSAFEIPVIGFDYKMPVLADTTAMSTPHEIEYTLTFDSATLAAAE